MNDTEVESVPANVCIWSYEIDCHEDPRINNLRKISYGFIMPAISLFGVIGNILNLIVLTRRNMQGAAYIYMRAYSAASLLAIVFCVPFALRVIARKETGGWYSYPLAFYHVHLELYLGNAWIGVGVMMLSALTVERHASVCQPGIYGRPVCGSPCLTALSLGLATFLLYLPSAFRAEMRSCGNATKEEEDDPVLYYRRDNAMLLESHFYLVYKIVLEVVYKVGPTFLLAALNLRIMLAYRRTCERRRRMRRTSKSFAEERRLMLLLGTTSLTFLLCVSPMIILNLTLSEDNLSIFSYQIFRAVANLLELSNYSLSFYIYCLFSDDFRGTLLRTLTCSIAAAAAASRQQPDGDRPILHRAKESPAATTTQTSSPTPALKPQRVRGNKRFRDDHRLTYP